MSDKRYLVTGGAGFIGSALVRRLVTRGASVRVLDNGSRGSSSRLADVAAHVEYVEGDVRDAEVVGRACAGIDMVCHLAYINGTRTFYSAPELVLDVGVRGMLNVIEGALRHDVPELVLVSSSEVYQSPPKVPTDETVALTVPDPLNPRYSYGGGKLISELLVLNYGRSRFRRVVVLRPHNVYGPDMGTDHVIPELAMRVADLARSTTGDLLVPIQGTGAETRAFVHIDDFIDGALHVIERGAHRNIYHVGTDEEVRIDTLAARIGRVLDRVVTVSPGPPAAGGTLRRCPDIGKLRALGYEPRVPLAAGLPATVRWYADLADRRAGRGAAG